MQSRALDWGRDAVSSALQNRLLACRNECVARRWGLSRAREWCPAGRCGGHIEEVQLMRVVTALLLVTRGAFAVVDTASAQVPAGDPAKGHRLAQEWCASCHAIEPGQPALPGSIAPSWAAVAGMPSTTSMALRAFLLTPHPRMPNLKLTRAQIDDIVAYILSLQER